MNIILCGLPLSGKSYYCQLLSKELGWQYLDTDRLIELKFQKENKHHPLTCREISRIHGEPFFRQLESQVIDSIKDSKKSIIALGGGAVCEKNNLMILKEMGKLIYLEADLAILLDRLNHANDCPIYINGDNPSQSYQEMALSRIPIYERCCDAKVSTRGLSDMAVLASIIRHIM